MSEAIVVDNRCCASRNAIFDHDGKRIAGPSPNAMIEPALIPQSDHQTGYFRLVWQPCEAETHPFQYDPLKNCEPETGSRLPCNPWRRMYCRVGMPMRAQGCVVGTVEDRYTPRAEAPRFCVSAEARTKDAKPRCLNGRMRGVRLCR